MKRHRPILSLLAVTALLGASGCDLEGKVGSMEDDAAETGGASDADGGAGSGDGGSESGGAGSDDGSAGDGGLSDQAVCEQTDGTWVEDACGHYQCGNPPDCTAVIPGCDCGLGKTFVDGGGCRDDATCQHPKEQVMCEDTGGVWDMATCGHYQCGLPQDCQSAVPGCDCGPFENFDLDQGCVADPDTCGAGSPLDAGETCDESADTCGAGLACCYPCGVQGCDFTCEAAEPGGGCPPPKP